jgi:catechol 2,3-dioxygenase-like lactoylglutathione lyase family enzyme
MTTSLAGVSLKCKDFDRTIDYYSRIVGLKSTKYDDTLEVEIHGGARMFFEQDRSLDDYRGRRLLELAKRAERLRQLEERRIRNYDPDNYVIIDEKGNRIELNDGGGEYDEDDLDDYFEDLLHIENDRVSLPSLSLSLLDSGTNSFKLPSSYRLTTESELLVLISMIFMNSCLIKTMTFFKRRN